MMMETELRIAGRLRKGNGRRTRLSVSALSTTIRRHEIMVE